MTDEDYIETTVQSLCSGDLDDLQLKLVTGDDGLGRRICRPRVQKPGLAFAGYYEYIKPWRVQIIGASETMYLQVDAGGADVASVLQRVSGVTRVAITDTKQQTVGYEVDSEAGRDVRRELAAAVVGRGWGLLEMRPMRLSLEEIFLHVTTEETPATAVAAAEAEMATSEEVVQ